MIKKVSLILMDIDGTMVNSERILTPYTREVLHRIRDNGIALGIASGRNWSQLLDDVHDWGFSPFEVVIGMNGGQVWDERQKKLYEYYKLSRETVRSIIEMMEPLDLNPFIYGPNNTMIAKRIDTATAASGERNDMSVHIVKDLSEFWKEPIPKIMYRTTLEQMPSVKAWADAHPSPAYKAFKTQTTMLEFCDPHVNKGMAMLKYAELENIPASEILAFGDMTNDNELLKEAGWGVCLKNGADDTKADSDDITEYTNDEDGMARYLTAHFPEIAK